MLFTDLLPCLVVPDFPPLFLWRSPAPCFAAAPLQNRIYRLTAGKFCISTKELQTFHYMVSLQLKRRITQEVQTLALITFYSPFWKQQFLQIPDLQNLNKLLGNPNPNKLLSSELFPSTKSASHKNCTQTTLRGSSFIVAVSVFSCLVWLRGCWENIVCLCWFLFLITLANISSILLVLKQKIMVFFIVSILCAISLTGDFAFINELLLLFFFLVGGGQCQEFCVYSFFNLFLS